MMGCSEILDKNDSRSKVIWNTAEMFVDGYIFLRLTQILLDLPTSTRYFITSKKKKEHQHMLKHDNYPF